MIEMFPDQGGSIAIGADMTESGDPAVGLQVAGEELRLTEDEAHMLVRHLMVHLEEARSAWFEKHHHFPKPQLKAVTER